MKKRTIAQERAAKGLCPRCGKEAAPYYLCADHRFEGKLIRCLTRGASVGGFAKTREGKQTIWAIGPGGKAALDSLKFRADPKEGDKRLRPRLGRVPVDVESEVLSLLRSMGRPATIEEIVAAWGRLREARKTASLVGDLTTIIESSRRRAEKLARRAAAWNGAR